MFILSIDGGGALGIGPASFLSCLDDFLEKKPDLYCGTSVGALLVSLAATGRKWETIRNIFRCECPGIFESPPFIWKINPKRPRYDGVALKKTCQKYFGSTIMNEIDTPIFLPSFDFKTGRPKIWDNSDKVPLWYAVLCSTAAPTYFPIVDGRYGDGGMVANNPCMVGISAAISKMKEDPSKIKCLSLGTSGRFWQEQDVSKLSKLGWIKPIINTMFAGSEELATFQALSFIGVKMMRIEPEIKHEIELDDVDKALHGFAQMWLNLWYKEGANVVRWLTNE